MSLCGLSQQKPVFDGSDSSFDYDIKNDEGDPLDGISSIRYKLSDNNSTLIDWTNILPADASGTINIPGVNNIISVPSKKDRELALYVVYSGSKVATGKATYTITEIDGVTPTSP